MLKSAIFITIMMLISKVLALGKEMLLAEKFGTSYITDAYMVAISLVNVLFSIFTNGFANSYIPVFMRVEEKERKNFFNNIFNILVLCSLAISIICFIFAKNLVSILAPGFDERSKVLTINFIKIIVFYLPFYTAFSVLSAHSNAKERFFCNSFCNFVIVNIILIISVMISSLKRINFLIYGYVFSMVIALAINYINLRVKKEIKYEFILDIKNNNFKQLVAIAIPYGFSTLINQINIVVDKIFSSSLGEGITSAINFADKIQNLPYTLIISTIIVIYRPRINKYFAENKIKEGIFYAKMALMISIYISLPIVIILFNFSIPIIELLLERGAFNKTSTMIVANSLFYYTIGIPFYSCREIASNILIANYKQKIILKNTVFLVILNIIFNYIFIYFFNYKGLVLATSISGIIGCILMNYELIKLNIFIFEKNNFKDIIKILCSSVLSSLFCTMIYKNLILSMNSNFALIASLFIFGISYLFFTLLLKVQIITFILEIFLKKLKNFEKRE